MADFEGLDIQKLIDGTEQIKSVRFYNAHIEVEGNKITFKIGQHVLINGKIVNTTFHQDFLFGEENPVIYLVFNNDFPDEIQHDRYSRSARPQFSEWDADSETMMINGRTYAVVADTNLEEYANTLHIDRNELLFAVMSCVIDYWRNWFVG